MTALLVLSGTMILITGIICITMVKIERIRKGGKVRKKRHRRKEVNWNGLRINGELK